MNNTHEKVTGIGGVFFRVRDSELMSTWYRVNLGIETKDGYTDFPWRDANNPEQTGRTVWALFPPDTDHFGPSNPAFMINYRVANLEKMLAQLQGQGITIEKAEDYDYGRFAWITDPEGNRIELWEPK